MMKEDDIGSSEDEGISDGSACRTFTSNTSEQNHATLADKYHHDFLSFLSVAQQLEIDFMSISWQPALYGLGVGASGDIMQSNMITKDLAFAFKRTTPKMTDKKRYRALLCEILALKAPAVQDHPNINQIEGIAWDIQGGIVWPVLVFSKANLGSLKAFAKGDAWDGLSFEHSLRLCVDIALGLHALHISSLSMAVPLSQNAAELTVADIIHGDIKPDNILVCQKGASLVAMITDFESSCVYGEESDLLTLPRTPPWDAPEWSDRYISVKNAKLMDIYSFGLVCFWILFQSNLGKMSLSACFPRYLTDDSYFSDRRGRSLSRGEAQ